MAVKVGVDVGGTFTKAVACDARSGEIIARSVVPTTHRAAAGIAEGVATAVAGVGSHVKSQSITLVAHSTTQAVNALLEGDTAVVGVLGIGRRPDLRRARKRTRVGSVPLAPGHVLQTRHEFVDASGGVRRADLDRAIGALIDAGARSLCISEAFAVDEAPGERAGLEAAAGAGVPACAGHELTGLYGLELRTLTAALNAGILPSSLRAAEVVEHAAGAVANGVPLLVMRGDGGAVSLRAMRRHPLLTAFSGPAASLAGALRHLSVRTGVVVEVGGTSTNVSAIKGGRPALSYVRVLGHVTCVRSLDVRVAGVAGGSLVRVEKKLRGAKVADVGPRSAHIAGLPYCSFATPADLEGAEARLEAPSPGDPDDYAVVVDRHGRRHALTVTCAANALGEVPANSYAAGATDAARLGFAALARLLGGEWRDLACRTLELAAAKVAAVVSETVSDHGLAAPEIVGLGGGAGALVPATARILGLPHTVPPDAEVISSVGDALSLVRVETEQALASLDGDAVARAHRRAEESAVAAGAAPDSITVESVAVPERRALRLVATGAVALDTDAGSPQIHTDEAGQRRAAAGALGGDAEAVAETGHYRVFSAGRRFAVIDRAGSVVVSGEGVVVFGSGAEVVTALEKEVPRLARHFGPVAVAPALRLVLGSRVVDLALLSSPEAALAAARTHCASSNGEGVVALLTRA